MTYGDTLVEEAWDIQATIDGGFIVAGETATYGAGLSDMWVVKLNAAGAIQWEKAYGGPDVDVCHAVLEVPGEGYVIAGETGALFEQTDLWVMKIDEFGLPIWEFVFVGDESETEPSIAQTSDGNYVVSARTNSYGMGVSDILVLRVSESGEIPDCEYVQLSAASMENTSVTSPQSVVVSIDSTEVAADSTEAAAVPTDKGKFSICPEDVSAVWDFESAQAIHLHQNSPNPFGAGTSIEFSLQRSTSVTLEIFNVSGELIARPLRMRELDAGRHKVPWDGKDMNGQELTSGVYFYRLETPTSIRTQKMVLVR
jgi:hypothetical protein